MVVHVNVPMLVSDISPPHLWNLVSVYFPVVIFEKLVYLIPPRSCDGDVILLKLCEGEHRKGDVRRAGTILNVFAFHLCFDKCLIRLPPIVINFYSEVEAIRSASNCELAESFSNAVTKRHPRQRTIPLHRRCVDTRIREVCHCETCHGVEGDANRRDCIVENVLRLPWHEW